MKSLRRGSSSRRDRRARTLVRCEAAQEAISAGLDGEPSPVPKPALEDHLMVCEACRAFADDILRLETRLALREVKPVPVAMMKSLVGMLDPVRPHGASSSLQRYLALCRGRAFGIMRWSAAALPAMALVIALLLGNVTPAHPAATHASHLCSPKLLHW